MYKFKSIEMKTNINTTEFSLEPIYVQFQFYNNKEIITLTLNQVEHAINLFINANGESL